MKAIETIIKQQQDFSNIVPKQLTAIDLLLKQQKYHNILLPKNFVDITTKLSWLAKMNSIRHIIPAQSKYLYPSNFYFENNIAKVTQNLKWIEKFQRISKSISEFDDFFKNGQNYDFYERDFAELYEDFDDTKTDNEIATSTSIIITETQRVKEIIKNIYLNNLSLFTIHSREFEKIIAELLYNQGFEVDLTKQTRDNGYDILAIKYINNFSPIKYLVECKRYAEKNKVGVEIVRSFKEVIATEQANKGIIVTSSYFTSDAIKKQKETPYLLDFKNKDEVINWVNEYMNKKTYR